MTQDMMPFIGKYGTNKADSLILSRILFSPKAFRYLNKSAERKPLFQESVKNNEVRIL